MLHNIIVNIALLVSYLQFFVYYTIDYCYFTFFAASQDTLVYILGTSGINKSSKDAAGF